MNSALLNGRIGDYELVEYLTAGGMADLYLARSSNPAFGDEPLVLKTIQPKYVEMTRVVKMFIDEGRIAKTLHHPNVVRIVDVGQAQGAYYIAMELIVGRDLLAIARRGIEAGRFLPMHLAAAILAQVATGLVYAHEKRDEDGLTLKIVHCDISPGNVVVSFGGTAKIVDFGIARAAIQLRAEDHTVAGKYNYMAPEQIRGEPLDARADLFALGIILYELTVGRRLFRGKADEVKARILAGDIPRPTDIRPELPPALERIILRALEIDRDRRYPNARAMRQELLDYIRADGHVAGKREIAEYLQSIFMPERAGHLSPSSTAGIDDEAQPSEALTRTFIGGSDVDDNDVPQPQDEELSLEAPVPGVAELLVDPDDPEPPPLAIGAGDSGELPALPTVVSAPSFAIPSDVPMPDAPAVTSSEGFGGPDDAATTQTTLPELPQDDDKTQTQTALPRKLDSKEVETAKTAKLEPETFATPRRRESDVTGKSRLTKQPMRGRRAQDPQGPLHLSREYKPRGHRDLIYAAIAIAIGVALWLAIRF